MLTRIAGILVPLTMLASACTRSEAHEPTTPCTGPDCISPAHFGFWGLNGFLSPAGIADVRARFGITVFQVAAGNPRQTVDSLLPLVRSSGISVTLRLVGPHDQHTDASGNFDISAWKKQVDQWAGSGLEPFIADGTLIGHMLLDDIHDWTWRRRGRDPTGDELDEMARYSRERFPGLMTFVREKASRMPVPNAGRYRHLDACVNQYAVQDGDIEDYVKLEARMSEQLDLGVINGLNIADGGDGSSGQPGWRRGMYAMSADEIRHYGSVLMAMPQTGMFLAWEYDGSERWSDGTIGSEYFDRPPLELALAELAAQMSRHPPMLRRKPPLP